MNQKRQYIHIAGIFVIIAAAILAFLVLLAELGLIHPRKRQLYISTPNIAKQYNGLPLENSEISITYGKLMNGHELHVVSPSSYTEIGEYLNDVQFIIQDAAGTDVTDRYDIKTEYGHLIINPITLRVNLYGGSKYYDGLPLSNGKWKHTNQNALRVGDTLDVTCTASISDVGKIENAAEFTVTDLSGKDVTHLYNVEWNANYLEILPFSLIVETETVTKVFDGQPISNNTWEIIYGSLQEGETAQALGGSEEIMVGTYPNEVRLKISDENGRDVTYRYDIEYTGTITIQPRKITVQTGSAEKSFDEKELSSNEWTITDGELCKGHEFSFVGTKRIEVGSSVNMVTSYSVYQELDNNEKVDYTHCYRITFEYGILTVKP